ncbi:MULTISPECIES: DNA-3-methyladenine glycosylase [unclassified Exiguobacterium]|uniref:DNA-3-methyladenine glycosylase n=1 Tax=unclassified Exiguobacterium TaxID=2644629 RepID=UPI00103BDA4A|nr:MULTISPECIES: DNA-3-methyladenine glycosylase [unclassified Exiguobacterium]TCI67638.1 DNA-3-methyladenine glycosylase [Exiguobacterium sp. SH0S7]
MTMKRLDPSFYEQPTLELARSLLGHYLVHDHLDGQIIGKIVETEAYLGAVDQAAHSFGGRRTNRTEIMFGQSGHVYTYQMHTHTLLNVVSGPIGSPEAVLIRAVEPVAGQELIEINRPGIKRFDRTNGPGKLTKALGITMDLYGHSLQHEPLYIVEGDGVNEIEAGPRIGIPNSGEARDYAYRFFERDNPYVSKFR